MRFRFTIRDLLWLTVVVALAVGWWLEHRQDMPAKIEQLKFSLNQVESQKKTSQDWFEKYVSEHPPRLPGAQTE